MKRAERGCFDGCLVGFRVSDVGIHTYVRAGVRGLFASGRGLLRRFEAVMDGLAPCGRCSTALRVASPLFCKLFADMCCKGTTGCSFGWAKAPIPPPHRLIGICSIAYKRRTSRLRSVKLSSFGVKCICMKRRRVAEAKRKYDILKKIAELCHARCQAKWQTNDRQKSPYVHRTIPIDI